MYVCMYVSNATGMQLLNISCGRGIACTYVQCTRERVHAL